MFFFPGQPVLSPIENRMKFNLEVICQERIRRETGQPHWEKPSGGKHPLNSDKSHFSKINILGHTFVGKVELTQSVPLADVGLTIVPYSKLG